MPFTSDSLRSNSSRLRQPIPMDEGGVIILSVAKYFTADGKAIQDTGVMPANQVKDADTEMEFDDNGMPFDPRGRPDPAPQKSLDEARIGGYGLMLVRHAARSLDYLRTADGHNRLTVRLPLGGTGALR